MGCVLYSCAACISLSLFLSVGSGDSEFKILDQNFNEIQIHDDELFQKLQKLDSQLKRNFFYIPTDKVITDDQVNHVIHAVSMRSNLKLADAVAAIVNVKLIKRLQFSSITKFYHSCVDLVQENSSTPKLSFDPTEAGDGITAPATVFDLDLSENGLLDPSVGVGLPPACQSAVDDKRSSGERRERNLAHPLINSSLILKLTVFISLH